MSQEYSHDKLREYYHALLEIKSVFVGASGNSHMVEENLVKEYEAFINQARSDLPGLLNPFNKEDYFSHNNGVRSIFYRADGIQAHIGRNLGILKVRVDTDSQTPVTDTKSFHFISENSLRKILERDYLEVQRNIISTNWKSAIILSGGSIEAILLDLLQKNEQIAKASEKAPSAPSLSKWNLDELIEVAVNESLVGKGVAKLSHSVREYRNLIHPGAEIRSGLKVEPEEAKIAIEVLHILIRELS
jgi:hypothetical protein